MSTLRRTKQTILSVVFQKLKSLTDSMNKTINSLKSENVTLILKNQRLKDFIHNLQNEVFLKKSQICHLKETLLQENNSLKERFKADSSKLEMMDKLITEFKKLNEDYEQLRLKHNQKSYEIEMIESMKNNQKDYLKNENHSLRDEIAQLKEKTEYLCRKRGNRN
jgi:cell division protein FtsB